MKLSSDTATAVPTKQFFVSMLTRDIKLEDAILDLIDNCLDGALRLGNGGKPDYAKYWVKITLAKDQFSIEDNCGGILREVAKNYAFKMGREPSDNRDSDTETIGMYDIRCVGPWSFSTLASGKAPMRGPESSRAWRP